MAIFTAERRFMGSYVDVPTVTTIDGPYGQQIPVWQTGYSNSIGLGAADDITDLPLCDRFTISTDGVVELHTDGTDSLIGPVGLTLDEQCYVELPFVSDRYRSTTEYFVADHLGRHGSGSKIDVAVGLIVPDTVSITSGIGDSARDTTTDYIAGFSGTVGSATGTVGANGVNEFFAVRGQSTDEIFLRIGILSSITTNIHAKISAYGKVFEVILKPVPESEDVGTNAFTTQLFRGESRGVSYIFEQDVVEQTGFDVDFYTL